MIDDIIYKFMLICQALRLMGEEPYETDEDPVIEEKAAPKTSPKITSIATSSLGSAAFVIMRKPWKLPI